MRIRRRYIVVPLLGLFLPALAAGYYFQETLEGRSYLAPWSGLTRLDDGLYVDPGMPPEERERVKTVVSESLQRVEHFFGTTTSRPTIIATYTPALQEWLGTTAGVAHRSLIGSNIVLSPTGENVDVLSHEWTHCVLGARVDAMTLLRGRLPVWFDEGLAMQNDRRPLYAVDAVEGMPTPEELVIIATRDGFQTGGGKGAVYAYRLARQEVARWYRIAGKKGLNEFIRRVKEGDDFMTAYKAVEEGESSR
jgi:hypothetical protein